MKAKPYLALALAAVLLGGGWLAQAEETAAFLAGYEDLPLMPGLEEAPESSLLFDKPGGRIFEGLASGRVSLADAREFYLASLPELGWRRTGKRSDKGTLLSFLREGEELDIQFTESQGVLTVQFSVMPR